jgi:molybdopterin-guanine dinucleotide biosynthesis protein A
LIVAACDLGRLDAASIARLIACKPDADVVVARGMSRHASLLRCSANAVETAGSLFASGERRLMRLLESESLAVSDCTFDEEVLANVNTPADLEL